MMIVDITIRSVDYGLKRINTPNINKIASRGGAPQASYDRRRHRNNFQTRPAQAFPKK